MNGVDAAAADQAAAWLTELMAADASDADRARWRAWLAADPAHRRAWERIEAACARLQGLHGGAAYRALSTIDKERAQGRRRSIALLLGIGAAGSGGLLATRTRPFQQLAADLRTGVGERREWTLADGTRVLLNTDSAVDLFYDARRRHLQLVAGEIRIVTGPASGGRARPFSVSSEHGRVEAPAIAPDIAPGISFTLRRRADRTDVAVQDGAIAVASAAGAAARQTVQAGQRTAFSARGVAAPQADPGLDQAWIGGSIMADAMRLGEFLAELARYRRGILRCDPGVADLRVSGVFPLRDTQAILAALPASMPVRVRFHHAWWVTVEKK